jgi:transcriptional regulator with XRE-family HTH domain
MDALKARFAHNLYRVRREAGLSQEDVGLRAGVHRTEVSFLERGTRIPRIDTVVKLAGALEVEPGELLDGMAWEAGEAVQGRFVETHVPGLGAVHRRFDVERE